MPNHRSHFRVRTFGIIVTFSTSTDLFYCCPLSLNLDTLLLVGHKSDWYPNDLLPDLSQNICIILTRLITLPESAVSLIADRCWYKVSLSHAFMMNQRSGGGGGGRCIDKWLTSSRWREHLKSDKWTRMLRGECSSRFAAPVVIV